MDTMSFRYEFNDFIKINLSVNRNNDKAKDLNTCHIEYCEKVNEGGKR